MTNATQQGILIKIKVRAWSASKIDKEIGEDTARRHGADKTAGSYSKKLIGKEALKGIGTARTALRAYHTYHTLHWDDDGTRLVPFKTLDRYKADMSKLVDEFNSATQEFIGQWDSHLDEAKTRLGDMYRAEDYPAHETLGSLFGVDIEYSPIPDGAFIPMDAPARDELVRSVEATTTAKLAEGTQALFFRLRNHLVSMRESLVSYADKAQSDDHSGRLHESLFENIRELVEVLPLLNITGDKFLEGAIERVRKEFEDTSAQALRGNEGAVRRVVGTVDSLLDGLPE